MKTMTKNVFKIIIFFSFIGLISCKPEPVTLQSIEITNPAEKTEYFVGEELDITGLEITAHYSNGTSKVVEGWGTEGFDSSSASDELEVKVLFQSKETSYSVKIIAVTLSKIEITKSALKTEYCINQKLDTKGLEVTATKNNGETFVVTDYTTEFDSSKTGDAVAVTIKYQGKEISYNVKVTEHTEDSGTITKTATTTSVGVITYSCSHCKKELRKELYCGPLGEDGNAATSASTYIYFGVFPKTVLASTSSVRIDETDIVTMGANTYYKGSDGEYYVKETKQSISIRYFKVEPVKWKVLTTSYDIDGTSGTKTGALLLAEDILTANVPYYYSNSGTRSVGADTTIYPNNYKYSQIRAYLNGLDYYNDSNTAVSVYSNKGFLQTAFTEDAQSLINTTTVDNSADSTTDAGSNITKATKYYCADTQDKIFLLSEQEASTTDYGFTEYKSYGKGNARIRVTTDYAKANYAYQDTTAGYGGMWWLRSPYSGNYGYACYVRYDGIVYENVEVFDRTRGVVPALSISF